MQPLEYPKLKYSNYELKRFALDIQAKKNQKAYSQEKESETQNAIE